MKLDYSEIDVDLIDTLNIRDHIIKFIIEQNQREFIAVSYRDLNAPHRLEMGWLKGKTQNQ